VSADDPLLDRAAIEEALRHLGDRLVRRGVVADLYIFGGAAMALAYDARRATRDIDAVFQPHGVTPGSRSRRREHDRQLHRARSPGA
jgi:hypothetical protein